MKLFDFNKVVVLENNRVKLSPLLGDHYSHLLPIALNNIGLLKYSPTLIDTEEKYKAYFETALSVKTNHVRYPFIIFDKLKNKYAGSTSFGNISNKDQRLEIGWTWIGRDFQGTGLNKNCKFLLLKYAFEELGFMRVELKTDARNQQSRRAIEKIGAKYEGLLRSHTLMSDGFRRDTVYYSILKNEWPQVKRNIFNME
ncbi:MAG: GNAT family protein [Bacteroidota bacterium]